MYNKAFWFKISFLKKLSWKIHEIHVCNELIFPIIKHKEALFSFEHAFLAIESCERRNNYLINRYFRSVPATYRLLFIYE